MKKLAIALQGSFGHSFYALGITHALRGRVDFCAGSSCVEMMGPLLLLFAPEKSITDYLLSYFTLRNLFTPKITADVDFLGHWFRTCDSYKDLTCQNLDFFSRTLSCFLPQNKIPTYGDWSLSSKDLYLSFLDNSDKLTNLLSDLTPRYQCGFNRSFINNKSAELDNLFSSVEKPVFTNAVNAETFREIYLYAGIKPNDKLLEKIRGKDNKRDVYQITSERFFASGARPPFFDPIKVEIDGESQSWMEGAMRCNPPLNPLIDAGADQILLIRFFSKSKKVPLPHSIPESMDRYLETVFTAPLEKEIETIDFISKSCEGNRKKPVEIFDPGDDKSTMYCAELEDLIDNKLTFLSHFKSFNPIYYWPMFYQGQQIGKKIAEKLGLCSKQPKTCYEEGN